MHDLSAWFLADFAISACALKPVSTVLGSHEGCLPEYLPSRTTVLAPGQFALKWSLLALYTGDTFSAKRFHNRLNQFSVFVLATIGP